MKFLIILSTLAFAAATYETQKYHGPQHIPVLDKHGVPVDTLEVQHARNAHLNQVAAAKSTHDYSQDTSPVLSHDTFKYYGPQHIPIIGKLGVPVDTKEVQHARLEHFLHRANIKANIAKQESSEESSSSSEEDSSSIEKDASSSEEDSSSAQEDSSSSEEHYGNFFSSEEKDSSEGSYEVKYIPINEVAAEGNNVHLVGHEEGVYKYFY